MNPATDGRSLRRHLRKDAAEHCSGQRSANSPSFKFQVLRTRNSKPRLGWKTAGRFSLGTAWAILICLGCGIPAFAEPVYLIQDARVQPPATNPSIVWP